MSQTKEPGTRSAEMGRNRNTELIEKRGKHGMSIAHTLTNSCGQKSRSVCHR